MGVHPTTATAPLAAVLLCGALASCSSGQEGAGATAAELEQAAQNLSATDLRPGAERAFANHGHPLSEGLVCSIETPGAPSPSGTPPDFEAAKTRTDGTGGPGPAFSAAPEEGPDRYLMVVCTGRTEDGGQASFEAKLPRQVLTSGEEGEDGLPGEFVGRVDREELFTTDCLQCSPGDEPNP